MDSLEIPTTAPAPAPAPPTAPPEPPPASRGQRVVQIVMLAGVGLVIAAGLVLMSGFWGGFDLLTRLLIAGTGAIVLAIAAAVVATRPPGPRALRETDFHGPHEGRRMLTAVLIAATSAMVAFTIMQLPTEPANNFDPYSGAMLAAPYWTAVIAVACALAVAVVGAWAAPGVVSTLAVWFSATALVPLTVQQLLWSGQNVGVGLREGMWQGIALSILGALGALVLYRWLRPAALTVALGVGTWFFSGLSAAMEGESLSDAPLDVEPVVRELANQTGMVGKVSLGILLVVGVALFLTTRAEWPWPAGAIASLVALTMVLTSDALGVAAALLITGVVLLLASGGMLLVWRRRSHDGAHPPATPTPA